MTSPTAYEPCTAVLGVGVTAADQADLAGQERQRSLALGPEQALGGQHLLEPFQPGQQLADADGADLQRAQRERAPVDPEVGPGVHHDARAVRHRRARRLEHRARPDDPDRHVGDRVAQGEVDRAAARVEVGDLPFDPDAAQPPDPAAHRLQHRAHGNGGLGRGLHRHERSA
jgi:hypothetical protein